MNPLLLIIPLGLVAFALSKTASANVAASGLGSFSFNSIGNNVATGGGGPTLLGPSKYWPYYEAAGAQYNVPPLLLSAQARRESRFNPNIVSYAGAQGLFQFMPATAAEYGLTNPFDPKAATFAAAHYLSDLYAEFGTWPLALAAYNAGPTTVRDWIASGGSWPDNIGGLPGQTQGYVANITKNAGIA
ncbi:MAG: lytic transglycosylase domain-containing protein [Acidobacteriaceae bacterium]